MAISNNQRDFVIGVMADLRKEFEQNGNQPTELSNLGQPNVAAGIRLKIKSAIEEGLIEETSLYCPLAADALVACVRFNRKKYNRALTHKDGALTHKNPFSALWAPKTPTQRGTEVAARIKSELNRVIKRTLGKSLDDEDIWDSDSELRMSLSLGLDPEEFVYDEKADEEEAKWLATSPMAKIVAIETRKNQ